MQRDAVERALDAGAVVVAEVADVVDDEVEVVFGHLAVAEHDFAAGVAGLGQAAKVHHDLEQAAAHLRRLEPFPEGRRQRRQQEVEVIGDDALGKDADRFVCHLAWHRVRTCPGRLLQWIPCCQLPGRNHPCSERNEPAILR